MHAALLSTFAGGAFSFGLNFGAPSMEDEARGGFFDMGSTGGFFEPVPEAVTYAVPMVVEVPSNSDNMNWRDRDGDSCWSYANHYNGAAYACTAPGYEDALYYCGKTCGRYKPAPPVPTDDMSWRHTDGARTPSAVARTPSAPLVQGVSWEGNGVIAGTFNAATYCTTSSSCGAGFYCKQCTQSNPPPSCNSPPHYKNGGRCVKSSVPSTITNVNLGCSSHSECPGRYCYSCAKCLASNFASMCGTCGNSRSGGSCGPTAACTKDNDSITGFCPGLPPIFETRPPRSPFHMDDSNDVPTFDSSMCPGETCPNLFCPNGMIEIPQLNEATMSVYYCSACQCN